jgi:monoamine oxidase
MARKPFDVVIIGGGAAGLAAANRLTAAGHRTALLEARGRLGGRIATVHRADLPGPVELGAEFIHGLPPETWDLVRAGGLTTYEVDGDTWYARDGRIGKGEDFWGKLEEIFEAMERTAAGGTDRSFSSFLEEYRDKGGDEEAARMAVSYVEGFHAAPVDHAGIKGLAEASRTEEAIDGDRAFRIADGYDTLIATLAGGISASGCEIHLQTIVDEINWRKGHVEVTAHSPLGTTGEAFTARAVLVAVPLGVLQAPAGTEGAIRFDPVVPEKSRAIEGLEMGQVVKITFRFRERFWEKPVPNLSGAVSLDHLSFLLSNDRVMPTWWSWQPMRLPMLTGWVGGTAAQRLAMKPDREIVADAIEALCRILGLRRPELEELIDEWYFHNWMSDPFARGAYSYLPTGGLEARKELARTVEETLFFAGETTYLMGEPGTVHGAIASGIRAAGEIVSSLGPP